MSLEINHSSPELLNPPSAQVESLTHTPQPNQGGAQPEVSAHRLGNQMLRASGPIENKLQKPFTLPETFQVPGDEIRYSQFSQQYTRLPSPIVSLELNRGHKEFNSRVDPSILFPTSFLAAQTANSNFDTPENVGQLDTRHRLALAQTIEGAQELVSQMRPGEHRDHAAHWLTRHHIHHGNFATAKELSSKITDFGWNSHTYDLVAKRIAYFRAEGLPVDISPDDEAVIYDQAISSALKAYSQLDSTFNTAVLHETLASVPKDPENEQWTTLVDLAQEARSEDTLIKSGDKLPDAWQVDAKAL